MKNKIQCTSPTPTSLTMAVFAIRPTANYLSVYAVLFLFFYFLFFQLIACAVNAACLSLLNSGLSMRFLVAAVNCIIDKDGEIILDPDHRQSLDARANLTFVFESVLKNTVTIYTTGKFTQGQYNDSMILCREASSIVFDFYKDVVKKMAKVL